jgi:hypothetical protein
LRYKYKIYIVFAFDFSIVSEASVSKHVLKSRSNYLRRDIGAVDTATTPKFSNPVVEYLRGLRVKIVIKEVLI